MLRSYDNSAEDCETERQPDRGADRGRWRTASVQVKPFFGFHLLSGLKAAPDGACRCSQAKFQSISSPLLALSLFLLFFHLFFINFCLSLF